MAVNARQTRVGINKATSGSWSTASAVATAVGAGDGHRVRDDMGLQLMQAYSYDDSAGQSFISSAQVGNTTAVKGAVPLYLNYSDVFMNPLWAGVFGTGGTAPSRISTTTAYTNTFEPATNKDGVYYTIVRDKTQYISEVPGAKFTGFELTFGEAGRAEVSMQFMGDREVNDSSINTATQVSALTYPPLGLRAFFRQAVFRINAQAGGALGASDAQVISSLRMTFTQQMDEIHRAGQMSIIEPAEIDHLLCEIQVTFPRFTTEADAFFDGHRDGTVYKGDLTLTGPAVEGANNYTLLFQFPHLAVPSFVAPVPGGGGNIAPSATFRALSTSTAPTGMTGVLVPIRLVTTGSASANPFA